MNKQLDFIHEVVAGVRRSERSLRVPVMLSHDEVDRILVNRLIEIRNCEGNKNADMGFIDKTIRFFLTEEEFEKYVIKNKLIKP